MKDPPPHRGHEPKLKCGQGAEGVTVRPRGGGAASPRGCTCSLLPFPKPSLGYRAGGADPEHSKLAEGGAAQAPCRAGGQWGSRPLGPPPTVPGGCPPRLKELPVCRDAGSVPVRGCLGVQTDEVGRDFRTRRTPDSFSGFPIPCWNWSEGLGVLPPPPRALGGVSPGRWGGAAVPVMT